MAKRLGMQSLMWAIVKIRLVPLCTILTLIIMMMKLRWSLMILMMQMKVRIRIPKARIRKTLPRMAKVQIKNHNLRICSASQQKSKRNCKRCRVNWKAIWWILQVLSSSHRRLIISQLSSLSSVEWPISNKRMLRRIQRIKNVVMANYKKKFRT